MSLMIAERPKSVDSERALATLWERAATLRDGLKTQDGMRYWVSYPGRPNARAGPDYLDAKLITEAGEIVTGDVELHLNAPDWYGHGHHSDPNYNGVVLHIVLSSKGHTNTLQHSKMQVPVASLGSHVEALESVTAPVETAGMSEVEDKLDRAGGERFLSRSRGFQLEMEQCAADQVIYRSVMEALGYASNRKPFRMLAEAVPFDELALLANEPASTRTLAIHAMLLRGSGLASIPNADDEHEDLMRLARLLPPRSTRFRPVPKDQWHLFRVRPSNHPRRRIQGAAQVLEGSLQSGLAKLLGNALISGGAKGVEQAFLARPYLGAARARDVAVNVALPFLHSLAELAGDKRLSVRSLEAYQETPALTENEITREMRRRLGIPTKARLSARKHQGLMYLYRSGRRT